MRRVRREGGRRHRHRVEDGVLEVFREGLAGTALEDVPDDRDAGVGVLRVRAGRIDELRAVQARDGRGEGRLGRVEIVADRRLAHEPRAVGHELAQRQERAEGILRTEIGKDRLDGDVEVEVAPLGELHDRDVGEELGDRSDPVDGRRRRGPSGFRIGDAEALRPERAVAVDEGDGKGRQRLLRHLRFDEGRKLRDRRPIVRRRGGCRCGGLPGEARGRERQRESAGEDVSGPKPQTRFPLPRRLAAGVKK